MLIDPNLLEKYAQNECDEAEIAIVEQWLNVTDFENEAIFHPQRIEIKEEMWTGIVEKTINAKSKFKRRFIYTAISTAACALFGMFSMHYYNSSTFGSQILVNNMNGQQAKKVNIGYLSFLVEPGSQCSISTDFFGQADQIEFCGAVSVISDSSATQEFNIATGTSTCDDTYKDKVKLRKGETYLAMTDNEYNVITATRGEIADGLPKVFSSRLSKRFNL